MLYVFIIVVVLIALYYFIQTSKVNRIRKDEQREHRREQHNEIIKKMTDLKKGSGNLANPPAGEKKE